MRSSRQSHMGNNIWWAEDGLRCCPLGSGDSNRDEKRGGPQCRQVKVVACWAARKEQVSSRPWLLLTEGQRSAIGFSCKYRQCPAPYSDVWRAVVLFMFLPNISLLLGYPVLPYFFLFSIDSLKTLYCTLNSCTYCILSKSRSHFGLLLKAQPSQSMCGQITTFLLWSVVRQCFIPHQLRDNFHFLWTAT